jgi:pimeloyl-ACP methyl ester carboxylesterase
MPYADNQGIRIHYHVIGNGPPLVLYHGLFANLGDWYDAGYVWALKYDYRLILIDGRGHGASDKPHEPEDYGVKPLVSDVIAVLDSLHLSKAYFLGYSWGAWVGYGLALYAPERFYALLLGGVSPQATTPADVEHLVSFVKGGVEGFAAAMDSLFEPTQRSYKLRRLSGDFDAYLAAAQGMGTGFGAITDAMAVLSKNAVLLLLYAGENDDDYAFLRDNTQDIPNATFISFPHLNHVKGFTEVAIVLPELVEYLKIIRSIGKARGTRFE